ncbi:MAG: carboxypeptidase-like regulatory domain-containing protein [Proteobacteria bacterium]|nr:carboxypeptidase-like regulatory domain-containing protein [Pseudomonadota bacterium]
MAPASPHPVGAQPMVRVKARCRLSIEVARVATNGATITARLTDSNGLPLVARRIEGAVLGPGAVGRKRNLEQPTDPEGKVRFKLRSLAGRFRARLSFGGDRLYEPCGGELLFDPKRVPVRLVPPHEPVRVDLVRAEQRVRVRVLSELDPAGVEVRLLDQRGTELAKARATSAGVAVLRVPTRLLGGAGRTTLTLRTRDDGRRQGARASMAVVKTAPVRLTLRGAGTSALAGETIGASGLLSSGGSGLPGMTVELFEDDSFRLATLSTDARGGFRTKLALATDRVGRFQITARFESDVPWLASARSEPWQLRVRASPHPKDPLWLALVAAVAGAAWLLMARKELRDPARSKRLPSNEEAGVGYGPRGTLRRANQYSIAGVVQELVAPAPVSGACIGLTYEGAASAASTDTPTQITKVDPVEVRCNETGRFHVERLLAGIWQLNAEAPGFAPTRATLVIPHRGELAQLRVTLESLRQRALQPFRRVACLVLSSASLWNHRTPREVLEAARARDWLDSDLEELTRMVEVAAYAELPPSRELIARIEQHATRFLATRAPHH